MDDGQKKKYMDLAAVDKKRYDKEKAQHIKKTQKENGGNANGIAT